MRRNPQPLPSDSSLRDDGYTVIPGALSGDRLSEVRGLADARLAEQEREHFDQFRFHGSMIPLDAVRQPPARHLVTHAPTLRALRDLGFATPRWLSGYIISKPPGSPALWWHQDWWAWGDPVSFADFPPQLFAMYYLTDVDRSNGALRVLPGSHRRRHALHSALPEAHSAAMNAQPEDGLAHAEVPGEVTVTVEAGDLVLGDARLLHATHPNRSSRRRTCLTLWYLPAFDALPDKIKSYVVDHPALPPRGWWREANPKVPREIGAMLPTYDGSSPPADYERQPPSRWPH